VADLIATAMFYLDGMERRRMTLSADSAQSP
jgi:hypothetical protein